MRHPGPAQLALFSGGDLGRWERWRIARHVGHCAQCRAEVHDLQDARSQLRQLSLGVDGLPNGAAGLPNGLNWDRIAEEMKGNIRVGLAAGEAIALFDKPVRSRRHFRWNAALVGMGAIAIFAVAFWTSLPPQQAD